MGNLFDANDLLFSEDSSLWICNSTVIRIRLVFRMHFVKCTAVMFAQTNQTKVTFRHKMTFFGWTLNVSIRKNSMGSILFSTFTFTSFFLRCGVDNCWSVCLPVDKRLANCVREGRYSRDAVKLFSETFRNVVTRIRDFLIKSFKQMYFARNYPGFKFLG